MTPEQRTILHELANPTFITHVPDGSDRQAIAAALAELDALRAEVEKLRAENERLRGQEGSQSVLNL
jgi:hypothetical protein